MQLPAVLDFPAASPLWTAILAERGKPLTLDASAVDRLGSACLQTLLAAQKMCLADGMSFNIVNLSAGFLEGLRMMAADALLANEADA